MTSTIIYTAIDPTYLYIKQHSITGLKYFGKTTQDPYTYNGSGKHWTNHIKVHGKEHIVTLWVSEPYTDTSIAEFALKFSAENDIVNSDEWANLIPENGLDGGSEKGRKLTDETKAKLRKPRSEETKANMRKSRSEETKAKQSVGQTGKKRGPYKKSGKPRSDKGKPRSEEAKANMRKPKSEEHKAKISAGNKGNPQPQITCPHCGKTGGNAMKRWHFDKCKA
jgi:hypothetical protein